MAITNGYATLIEVKAASVLNFSNTDHDAVLEPTIEAVSRMIDEFCGRHFFQVTETRYYTPEDRYCLDTGDIASTSGFALYTDLDGDGAYEYTWAATDYSLTPYSPTNGWAYTGIETTPLGLYYFPLARKSVKVTATWGFPATPKPVNRACVMQTVKIFQRYKTMLGVTGASAVGTITMQVPGLDADVKALLFPYRKLS